MTRFDLLVLALLGQAPPPPPAIKGVIHRAPRPTDVEDDAAQTEREQRAAEIWAELAREINAN